MLVAEIGKQKTLLHSLEADKRVLILAIEKRDELRLRFAPIPEYEG